MKSLMVKDEVAKQVRTFAANKDMKMQMVVELALAEYFKKASEEI